MVKYDRSRRSVTVDCSQPSRTKQSFRDECDINTIVQRWLRTGVIDHVARITPQYADVSQLPASYQEALDLVRTSEREFASLPAAVRRRYDNDPALFLTALSDPSEVQFLLSEGVLEAIPQPPNPSPSKSVKPSEKAEPKAKLDESSPE